MDLRRQLFHHHDHPHVRCENVLPPPDFIPPPYTHHLPPPPPTPEPHLPHIHLPPPPPPPVLPRHTAHPPISPRFAFSPPHHSLLDRPHLYEIDPPRKPYFHHNLVPPPPPPPPPLSPPIENRPLRFMHEYPERNSIFRDEIFRQGYCDKYIHELPEIWDRDLRCGARELHSRVPYKGDHDRYRETFRLSRDLYHRRDDDGRWDNGTNNWGRDLCKRRDDDGRWDNETNNWGRELYNRRDYYERRWDDGINERGREMYYERDYDERRWDSVINEQGFELYNDRNYEERSWDDGINELGREFYRDRDCNGRRWDYGSNDGILLHLENRQREFVGDDLSLGRFNGRLGRGVTDGEFIRSKKKRRLQEKDALHRIQFGKDCSRHDGDHKCQHSLKESSRSSFRGKEKDRCDWFPTRSEDMGQREQSPLELAISFKSNSLIAKAIFAPTRPDLKSDVSSTEMKDRMPNSLSGSSSSKSSEDVVKNDVLTSGLDLPSDSQGTARELPDKAAVSGSGSVTADNASDLVVKNEPRKEVNLQGPTDGRTHANRLRKKRTRKQLLCESSPQMKNNGNDTSDADDCSNILSAVPLNSDTALSKGNLSSTIIGEVPDTGLLPSLGGIVSDNDDNSGDSDKAVLLNLKRKRTSLKTLSASSYVADKVTSKCSHHADRYTYGDTDHACQLTTDKGEHHACQTFLANENTGQGDSLGINQHANNVDNFVHNRASELDAENGAIESIDHYARLRIDRAGDATKHCFQDGLLEKSFVEEPSRVVITVEGHDIACSSRPQEASMPEVQEDKYFSEIHELNSSSESEGALFQKPENVIISDMGSADANSKGAFSNLDNIPQVEVTAKEFRSLEVPAVADCSNISFGMSTSSNFLSADHQGIVAQFGISSLDALSEKSFADGASLHNIDSVEGSSEAIAHVKPCLSINYSPKIVRKRKAGGAQMGLSGSNTNMVIGKARLISGEVARLFAKDLVPDVEVGFLGDKDSWKEDGSSNEGSHGVEDSTIGVNFGTNGSIPVYKKKRKVVSPRSNLLSFSEDDTIQNGLTSYCTKLEQGSTRLAEWGAEQIEDIAKASASASAAINKCSSTDVEDKSSGKNFYVADLDDNLSDGNKRRMNVDLSSISHHLSLCADGSDVLASNSGDELLASGFDMQSCMSSPEELLSFSDFSRNTKTSACQSENEMIERGSNMSDETLVSGDPSTFSLGKSLAQIASDNSQTNAKIPPSLAEDINKAVEKLNLVHGKLAMTKYPLASAGPKVFSGHHPPNFSNSRKFHSIHVTKSRTWHRTGNNSVAVTEPKLQSSLLPQSHVTKTAGTTQNSYIRKGNSLVRKPSPAAVSLPGCHGSTSSVYRLNACTDNLKSNQASNSKTHHAVGPTVPRVEWINTSEMPEALSPNHGGPGGNPTRSSSPFKTSDALEESMKSPIVPECPTDPVINSDSQGTLEEGNMRKKIMYVKRRSNQLVAASNSDDTSMLGVDKTQASMSDGYYKSKKNQLLRASPENHVKKEDANVNSCWLVSHTIIPRSSTRRQSFAKTYRHLKFSSVWKLHDTQSSEKHKNLVGTQKVSPHLFPKKATYWRSFIHALGTKPKNSPFPAASQKLLLSRKRGAIYTRSVHGYSLRMSKVLSVGGASLKWSKSIERNSVKANEEATRAVAAAEKRKKEEKDAVSTASKSRNHVSRKSVLSVKLRPGERIFRIGSERYKMDSTRKTLHRITEKEPSSSVVLQSEKNVKRSYVPRRLLIGNEEYVRIGNGNQLVRDPKKRTRILASEKVRWSLRTARLRLARKRKYCQFFTRFGKCNKEDGKCPYIHDPSKIVVCTKFLNGSCSNPDCKLTHEVIPERMQDCSYFLKGSCSNENCPYRHVNVDPDSTVCESFLRGYCADGNECRKKHTYVCPAFEAMGSCPQAATCKLHHPKKKTEKKPSSEQKIVRGRYFDGGLIGDADCSMGMAEKLSSKGKDGMVCHVGKFPDYISLDVSDDEEMDQTSVLEQVCDDILPDAQTEPVDE